MYVTKYWTLFFYDVYECEIQYIFLFSIFVVKRNWKKNDSQFLIQ